MISGRVFSLISSFLSNKQLQVVLDRMSSQEYPVNAGVPQSLICGPTLLQLYIVTFYIAAYVNDTTLYSKEDQAYNL